MKLLKEFVGTKQTSTKLNEKILDWNDADIEISVSIRGNDDEVMGFKVNTMSELKAFVDAADKVNPWVNDDDGVEFLMDFDDLSTLLQSRSRIKMYTESTNLNENYNITPSSGGGGYLESFMGNQKERATLEEIIKQIKDYVKVSAQWAEDEGVTPEEQHKAIVEDILSYILVKVK